MSARSSAAGASPRPPSLLAEAVERERLRQAHREASAVRKAVARPPAAPPAAADSLFADWDAPDAVPQAVAEAASPPAVAPSAPSAAVDDAQWRPLLDPAALIDGVMRSRGLIASTTILGALAGVAIALSTPKQYPAIAELLVDPRNLQIVDRDLTGNGYMASEATLSLIENQVRIMRSGPVLAAVVDKLNLDADAEFNGAGKAFGVGAFLSGLRSLLSSDGGQTEGEKRVAVTIENLARAVSIDRTGKTFVVVVEAQTREPEKSALIANALVDVYLAKAAEFQADNAGRATEELGGRLEAMRNDVEASERKVESYKAEQDLVDAKGVLIGDDELVRLNDQLTVARARTLELNARAASARGLDAETVIGGSLPEQVGNSGLAQLRAQHAAASQELARSSVRLGPRHPARQAAEAQVADARAAIERELRRIQASVQVEMRRAVQLEQELAARLAQLKARQATVSDKLVELRELERDAASKRSVYEAYLLRARETGELKGVNTANISVISKATPALEPVGPSRAMISILGVVMGFLAGLGLGMARGAWTVLRRGAPAMPPRPDPAPPRARRAPVVDQPGGGAVAPAPVAAPPPAEAVAAFQPPPIAPTPPGAPPTAPAWPQPPVWPPQPVWMAPPAPAPWFQPQPFVQPMMMPMPAPMVYAAPPAPVWPQAQPVPAPEPAAPSGTTAPDQRLDALRHGLERFRRTVEDIAVARPRRR